MSIDLMKVFFRCPNCGHEEILLDYHENTSSERFEFFVVLNRNDKSSYGEVLKGGKFCCKNCGESVPFDYIFQSNYCSVENINAYLDILEENLLSYLERGYFSFSDWHRDETPFPALDRLICMYPENQKLREIRNAYKEILFLGKKALKKYTKVEIRGEIAGKGCVLIPPILKKVYLHDGVKTIGQSAFFECSSLQDIYLPYTVTQIDEDAFRGCRSLKTIHMSDKIKRIEKRAFFGCHDLGSIYIPESLSFIGEEAFLGCKSLKKLWLPKGITVDKNAFAGCIGLSLIEAHDSIEADMLLEAGVMPETTIIRYSGEKYPAFEDSTNEIPKIETIEHITYPEGIEAIDDTTFTLFMCRNIKHVSIPSSVTLIGRDAFCGCEKLQEVKLPDRIISIENGAFMYCSMIRCITIPKGVVQISPYIFAYCSNLKTIVLPPVVNEIGEYAFEYCSSLSEIEFPDSLTSIGENAFFSCKSLEMVRIPSNVKTIERESFSGCSSLKYLRIENGTEQIKYGAFMGTAITSVYLPESVNYVERHAFDRCKYLRTFEVSVMNSKYTVQNKSLYLKDPSTLYLCPSGMEGEYEVAQGTKIIAWGAFSNCSGLTKIILPPGVNIIESFAFSHCDGLIEIVIPNSVTQIGAGAFSELTSLKRIYFQGTPAQWSQIEIDIEYNDFHRLTFME